MSDHPSPSVGRAAERVVPLASPLAPGQLGGKHELSQADASKGGTTTWLAYERRPGGRKRLPRLNSTEVRLAGRRGGYTGRTPGKRGTPSETITRFS